jgi:hypothetical protein
MVGMAFCFASLITLVFLGRKSDATDGQAHLAFREWDLKIDPKSSSEKTVHFWPIMREMRSSLGTNGHYRLIYGSSAPLKEDHDELEVVVRAKQLLVEPAPYMPMLAGFLMRDRDGYRQVVDVQQQSGFPDFAITYNRQWSVRNCKRGERLELVLMVSVSSAEKLSQIKALDATFLVETDIHPPRGSRHI